MITNLLPGLRDLRTPLAAGYLWLVALWLFVHKYLPTSVETAKGPLRSLYELGDFVGQGVVLGAATFVAYMLGSLIVRPFAADLEVDSSQTDEELVVENDDSRTNWVGKLLGIELTESALLQLMLFVDNRLREIEGIMNSRLHREVLDPKRVPVIQEGEDPEAPILNLRSAYGSSIVADLKLIGIQLQARNRDFWDTYDRKTAETDFRYGIVWPLVAIIIIISWQSSWFWLFLLIIPIWFLVLAGRLSAEVEATLVQAIVLGMVVPPVLEDLDKVVQRRSEVSGPQTDGKSPQATSAAVEARPASP